MFHLFYRPYLLTGYWIENAGLPLCVSKEIAQFRSVDYHAYSLVEGRDEGKISLLRLFQVPSNGPMHHVNNINISIFHLLLSSARTCSLEEGTGCCVLLTGNVGLVCRRNRWLPVLYDWGVLDQWQAVSFLVYQGHAKMFGNEWVLYDGVVRCQNDSTKYPIV